MRRNELLRQQQSGAALTNSRATVAEWLTEWLGQKKGKVEPNTWHWYERRVRRHLKPAIGALELARLNARAVEGMHAILTEKWVSPSEQFKAAATPRAAPADAVSQGLMASNPATRVKKPKVQRREMRPLDRDEAVALLRAVQVDRLRSWYDMALDTGPAQAS